MFKGAIFRSLTFNSRSNVIMRAKEAHFHWRYRSNGAGPRLSTESRSLRDGFKRQSHALFRPTVGRDCSVVLVLSKARNLLEVQLLQPALQPLSQCSASNVAFRTSPGFKVEEVIRGIHP